MPWRIAIKNTVSNFYFTKDHFYKITLEAFRTNDIVQMEKEICQADLLIIDDVHMVSGSKAPKVTEILMKLLIHSQQATPKSRWCLPQTVPFTDDQFW